MSHGSTLTSALSASAIWAITSLLAGLITGKVFFETASTHSLLMKSFEGPGRIIQQRLDLDQSLIFLHTLVNVRHGWSVAFAGCAAECEKRECAAMPKSSNSVTSSHGAKNKDRGMAADQCGHGKNTENLKII